MCLYLTLTLHYSSLGTCKWNRYSIPIKRFFLKRVYSKTTCTLIFQIFVNEVQSTPHRLAILRAMALSLSRADWGVLGCETTWLISRFSNSNTLSCFCVKLFCFNSVLNLHRLSNINNYWYVYHLWYIKHVNTCIRNFIK